MYDCRPSEILGISETIGEYEAFCFDEALCYIISQIREGEEPNFTIKDNDTQNTKHYSSASEMYNSMGLDNRPKKFK